MADTPTGETATPETVSNDVSASAPVVDNASTAELEKARKDAEQARMRANQLENELADRRKSDDETKKRQLEENEEYKQLYEKSDAELKRIREEQDAAARQSELDTATQDVLKDYPVEVIEIAKTAGLSLTDDSEASRSSLTEKLNSIKERVVPSGAPVVTSNNPYPAPASQITQSQALEKPHSLGVDNGSTAIRPDANPQKVNEYLRNLPVMDQIKRSSGYYR